MLNRLLDGILLNQAGHKQKPSILMLNRL